jgi:hypothetical protein
MAVHGVLAPRAAVASNPTAAVVGVAGDGIKISATNMELAIMSSNIFQGQPPASGS